MTNAVTELFLLDSSWIFLMLQNDIFNSRIDKRGAGVSGISLVENSLFW